MANFSPKIEIINHFDKLINRVDIDIEESLKKYDDNRIIGELKIIKWIDINYWKQYKFNIIFFRNNWYIETNKQTWNTRFMAKIDKNNRLLETCSNDLNWRIEKSTRELRKAQEDTLENYKLNPFMPKKNFLFFALSE